MLFGTVTNIEVNNRKLPNLWVGSETYADIPEGDAVITASTPTARGVFIVRFKAKRGSSYHFNVRPKTDRLLLGAGFGEAGKAIAAEITDTSGCFELELAQ